MTIARHRKAYQGDIFDDTSGVGLAVGQLHAIPFPVVASLADGVAIATAQARLFVHKIHRLRGVEFSIASTTAVAAGTDPAFDVYKSMPVPSAPTAALASPVAAGNVDNGAHDYAVAFYTATGCGMPSAVTVVTVADKTTNGQVVVNLPIGPAGCTGRRVLRSKAGAHQLYTVANVANNTALTYTDNTADSSLSVAAPIADASAETVLTATVKGSATTRSLCDQTLPGTLAIDQRIILDPCMYTLHALTGATTGALANLQAYLLVEYCSA